MFIYLRNFIIIIAAKYFIPLSARITDSYSNHQAQIKNRDGNTNPEDYVQNEVLDHQGGEQNHHISSSSHANENNDLSEQDYHFISSYKDLGHYPKDKIDSNRVSILSSTNTDSKPDNDVSEHIYHSTQTVSYSDQEVNHYQQNKKYITHKSYSSYENKNSQPDNDVSYSHHFSDDSESDNDNFGQSETYIDDVEFHHKYTDYLAQSEISKNKVPPIISDYIAMNIYTLEQQLKKRINNQASDLVDRIDNLKDDIGMNIHTLELALMSKINNLTNKMESAMENLSKKLDDKTANLTIMIKNNLDDIKANLTIIIKHQGCPADAGFIYIPSSGQCMKLYNDTKQSWSAANSKCQADGLVLARTEDPVSLRNYLLIIHGVNWYTWIGARFDGSNMRWQSDNKIIPSSSSYWKYYKAVSTNCLLLLTENGYITRTPTKPFYTEPCANNHWTLCEFL